MTHLSRLIFQFQCISKPCAISTVQLNVISLINSLHVRKRKDQCNIMRVQRLDMQGKMYFNIFTILFSCLVSSITLR